MYGVFSNWSPLQNQTNLNVFSICVIYNFAAVSSFHNFDLSFLHTVNLRIKLWNRIYCRLQVCSSLLACYSFLKLHKRNLLRVKTLYIFSVCKLDEITTIINFWNCTLVLCMCTIAFEHCDIGFQPTLNNFLYKQTCIFYWVHRQKTVSFVSLVTALIKCFYLQSIQFVAFVRLG